MNTVTLFARFLLGWIWTLLVSAAACVLMLLLGPDRGWLMCAQLWGRGALAIIGVEVKIEGAEHLKGPAVFVSNHRSLIDIVVLPAILPREIRFVVKRELRKVPLFGWALGAAAVVIDRSKPKEAIESINAGLERLPPGWSVVVFPEGTRARSDEMLPFKKGAFFIAAQTGLPIVPIGLDGTQDIVRPGESLVRPGTVCVTVGPPIPSAGWDAENIETHMEHVREVILSCRNASRRRLGREVREAA